MYVCRLLQKHFTSNVYGYTKNDIDPTITDDLIMYMPILDLHQITAVNTGFTIEIYYSNWNHGWVTTDSYSIPMGSHINNIELKKWIRSL
jgi:hypothetical protein|tara:strand:+ start:253 stop:522 length:270 start_codon:yes stop_codon:yes gene_type:complete